MKKSLLYAGLACLTSLALLLPGCGGQKNSGGEKPAAPATLKITYVKSPLNISVHHRQKQSDRQQGFYEKPRQKCLPGYNSGAKKPRPWRQEGSLDICSALGGTSAILAASNGVDLKIVGTYSVRQGFQHHGQGPFDQDCCRLERQEGGRSQGNNPGTRSLLPRLGKEGLEPGQVEFLSMGIPESVNAMSTAGLTQPSLPALTCCGAQKAGARIIANG